MVAYDLDDDDDDDDFILKGPTNKPGGNSMVNRAMGRTPSGKFDLSANGGSGGVISPYIRGGLVEKAIKDSSGVALREEHLGDDFLETPWRIPNLDKAKEYRASQVFLDGNVQPMQIHMTDVQELGTGLRMYFHFTKSVCVGLVFMSLFSLPLLGLAYFGTAIPAEDRDTAGLYQYSLGNIGDLYPKNCMNRGPKAMNETCVDIAGYEVLSTEVSLAVTSFELLQVLVLLFVLWHLRRRFWKYHNLNKVNKPLSITHYAVYVENLPLHVTEVDIISHFSALYQLDKPDWRRRPPVEDARPVQNCDNTGNSIHNNTWIAECTIYRKIGTFLRLYREKEQIVEALYRNRAKMKMYAYDTAHADGADETRYKTAEKAMLKVAHYIDYFTLKIKDTVQGVVDKGVAARNKSHAKWQKRQQKSNQLKALPPLPSETTSNTFTPGVVVEEKSSSWWGCFSKNQPAAVDASSADNNNTSTSGIVVDTVVAEPIDLEAALDKVENNGNSRPSTADREGQPVHDAAHDDNVVTIFHADDDQQHHKDNAAAVSSSSPRPTSASSSTAEHLNKSEPSLPDAVGIVSNVVNDAKPVGAFVCFEYNESFARCMEDYRKYSSFPYSLFYPKELLLHGHRLRVSSALEPDLLIVENLEISNATKFLLKSRTVCLTALLMIVCFIVILGAAISKTIYSDSIPSDYLCTQDLPALYAGPNYNDKSYIEGLTLIRPPLYIPVTDPVDSTLTTMQPLRAGLDANCSAIIPNSFYAIYAEDGKFSRPSANYSLAACPNVQQDVNAATYRNSSELSYCPVYRSEQYCPCITTVVQEDCATYRCQKSISTQRIISNLPPGRATDATSDCRSEQGSYHAEDLVYCYCKQGFFKLLSTDNMWTFVSSFINSGQPPNPEALAGEDGEYCGDFQGVYMSSYLLNYGAIVVTVLINRLLRLLLLTLSKYEGHVSLDDLHYSIFLKMLITTYVNMAIIVLLAFGVSPSFDTMPPTIHPGIYTDFQRAWFSNIGFYLITTFLFTAYLPILTKYLHYKIVFPLKLYFARRKIKDKKGHHIAMQHDLNKCEVGTTFDYTQHVAQVMALLFFTMTYAPGLPLLTPLMMVLTFAYFSLDKILLLRYHRKPPVSNDRIMKTVVYYCLPLAVLMRLCVAMYMFSSPDHLLASTFPTYAGYNYDIQGQFNVEIISLKNYEDVVMQGMVQPQPYYIPIVWLQYLEDRVKQSNVFPLFVLFIIVLLCIVGEYLVHHVLRRVLRNVGIAMRWVWKYLCCCCSKSKHINLDKLSKQELYLQAASKERGYIQPYNLLTMKDPLRQEVAPFTGIYYQFIGRKKDRNLRVADGKEDDLDHVEEGGGCCGNMRYVLCCQCLKCCRFKKKRNQVAVMNGDNPAVDMVNLDEVMDLEESTKSAKKIKSYDVNGGWEITEMGLDFEVKVKVWSTTGLGADGVLRNKGQHKRTFEVLADNHCHSYQLQFLPNYKLAYLALRDQEGYLLVDDYLKRRSEWQGIRKFKPKEAEEKMLQQLVENQMDAIRDKESQESQEKVDKERRLKALAAEDEKKEDDLEEGDPTSNGISTKAKAGFMGMFRSASSRDNYSLAKDEPAPPAKQETKASSSEEEEDSSEEEDSDEDEEGSEEESDSDDDSYEDSDDSDK